MSEEDFCVTKNRKVRPLFIGVFCIVAVLCVAAVSMSINAKAKLFPDEVEIEIIGGVDEYYPGQTCDHDDSYVEPTVSDGRYYPNGDADADYYIEIIGSTVTYKNADGSVLEDFVWNGGEFRVITQHALDDNVVMAFVWTERTDEEIAEIRENFPNFSEKYIASYCSYLIIEDGEFKISPYPANEKLREDFQNGIYCTAVE